MSSIKKWIVQLRYPYTAGVIAVQWVGAAILAILRPEIDLAVLVVGVAIATLIIAAVGFSSPRR